MPDPGMISCVLSAPPRTSKPVQEGVAGRGLGAAASSSPSLRRNRGSGWTGRAERPRSGTLCVWRPRGRAPEDCPERVGSTAGVRPLRSEGVGGSEEGHVCLEEFWDLPLSFRVFPRYCLPVCLPPCPPVMLTFPPAFLPTHLSRGLSVAAVTWFGWEMVDVG